MCKEYIEREAVIKLFNFTVLDCLGMEPTIRAGDIIKALESIPAADVRPVVRGKWKVSVHKTYYDVSCSVCGINSFFQVDEKDSVLYANYCPNCGADMMEKS